MDRNLKSARIASLDFLRGFTVSAMILVNNPGSWAAVYSPLRHAGWHGCKPADLIFPFFVFIMGVSIVCSFFEKKKEKRLHAQLLKKIIRRTVILCCLGLFLNGFPEFDISSWRIPGILQRIGIVYFFCAIIYLKTGYRGQVVIGSLLLILYWFLMTIVPVPGIGNANLDPVTNLAAWVDRLVLGGHLWSETRLFDPEGILSTIPAVGTGIIGMFAGSFIKSRRSSSFKTSCFILTGAVMTGAGLLWNLVFPINKTLWTGSYVLFTAGIALAFLGASYFIMDIKNYKRAANPFIAMGMNALFLFCLSSLLGQILSAVKVRENLNLKKWLFENLFSLMPSDQMASLAGAIVFVTVFLILACIMQRYRLFVKV